jgi:hypothetical protein
MAGSAEGIPDRENYGDVSKIPLRKLITYVDQLHKAERAGTHHDIRFGDRDLYSWAGKYGLPKPGEKRTLFQQPLHSKDYADFQGEIEEGYGKGTVETHDRGTAFVTEATPDKIKFVVAHKKYPEYYTLIKTKGKGKPWLIVNHTPQDPGKVVGDRQMFKKKHLGVVPAERVEEVMDGVVEGKIDGASGLFKLKDSSIDVMSFRVGKGDRPIMHTERFFGGRENKFNIPKEFRDRVARGEIYGVNEKGNPVGAQATSPLLNMSLENSLRAQDSRGVNLRAALFGFADKPLNYPEREKELAKLLKYLPADKFGRPPVAHNRVDALKLWREIESGKHPETDEGIVAYPEKGNPIKVKLRPEQDVRITDVFPGEGKYTGSAGGIEYEGGGRVGTGFDDAFRQWMWDNRDALKGRVAKITSTKQLPSGKHYQPSFVSLHEDYPTKEASLVRKIPRAEAMQLLRSVRRKLERSKDKEAVRAAFGVGRRFNHEHPKMVDIEGKKVLLHYRAANSEDALKKPFNTINKNFLDKHPNLASEAMMRRHVRGSQHALSTTTSLNRAKEFLSGRGKNPVVGVYGTPLEKLIHNQRNKTQAAMLNSRYPREQEITQLNGDNLLKTRYYKPVPPKSDFEDVRYLRKPNN